MTHRCPTPSAENGGQCDELIRAREAAEREWESNTQLRAEEYAEAIGDEFAVMISGERWPLPSILDEFAVMIGGERWPLPSILAKSAFLRSISAGTSPASRVDRWCDAVRARWIERRTEELHRPDPYDRSP